MAYNCIDLIDGAINIGNKVLEKYKYISNNQEDMNSIKILTNIFIKQQQEKINYYNSLKEKLKSEEIGNIDFVIYDKISSLIIEFNNTIVIKKFYNKEEFIERVLTINKEIRALFIDVRSRLMKREEDFSSCKYNVASNIINMEEKYIDDLEKTLNI